MRQNLSTREMAIIALFTAITVILSQIIIVLPFTPVPISFSVVAVLITGLLLPPRHAVLVQVCYLLLGSIGLPVFGKFHGGVQVLVGPTGGFLMAYPLVALLIAYGMNTTESIERESLRSKRFLYAKATAVLCLALLLLYTGGVVWFVLMTGTPLFLALPLTVFPFIPLDLVKIAFCVLSVLPLRASLRAKRLFRT